VENTQHLSSSSYHIDSIQNNNKLIDSEIE